MTSIASVTRSSQYNSCNRCSPFHTNAAQKLLENHPDSNMLLQSPHTTSIVPVWLIFILLIPSPTSVRAADLADELSDLTDYIVFSTERIEEYEGCEYGKILQFQSQAFIKCDDYGYQYAYCVQTVTLVRPVGEGNYFTCKMAVEDEVYDVDCAN